MQNYDYGKDHLLEHLLVPTTDDRILKNVEMPNLRAGTTQEQRDNLSCGFSTITMKQIDEFNEQLSRCRFLAGCVGWDSKQSEKEALPDFDYTTLIANDIKKDKTEDDKYKKLEMELAALRKQVADTKYDNLEKQIEELKHYIAIKNTSNFVQC